MYIPITYPGYPESGVHQPAPLAGAVNLVRVRYKLQLSTCEIYVQFIVRPIFESPVHRYIIVSSLYQRRSVIGLEERSAADRGRANWSRAGRSRAGRRGNRHSRNARETRAADSSRRRRSGAQRSASVVLAIDRRSPAGDLARSGRASSRDLAGRRRSSARVAELAKLAPVENARRTPGVARGEDRSRQVGISRRSSSRVAELAKLREGDSATQESSEDKNSGLHAGMKNTSLRKSWLGRKIETSGETAFITTRPWTVDRGGISDAWRSTRTTTYSMRALTTRFLSRCVPPEETINPSASSYRYRRKRTR